MFNGVKTVQTTEGEKYELHADGKSKQFDDRNQAYSILALHMAKDAGRVLAPEEERQLITYEEPPEAAVASTQ